MGRAGGVSPFFVLLCAHGPRKGTKLTYLKDQRGRFPTELVAERLRDQLEFPPADDDTPPKLRGIFYATTPEAAQTTELLLGGIAAPKANRVSVERLAEIRSACDGTLTPLERAANVICIKDTVKPGVDNSKKRSLNDGANTVPVIPCPLLRQEKFQVGADRNLFRCLLAAAARKDPVGASCDMEQDCCLKQVEWPSAGNAILVVGHRPQLGWLACEMMRRHGGLWRAWRTTGAPLGLGEIVCIRFASQRYRSSRIRWTISPDDESAVATIRDKIRSKMETAKLVGGLISLLIAALLGVVLDQEKLKGLGAIKWAGVSARTAVGVSAVLLFLALILFVASYYSYDRLLMPSRFWVERRPPRRDGNWSAKVSRRRQQWLVRRPPSSTAWVLYANMMRVWRWLFTPATVCGGLALAVPAVVLMKPPWWVFLLTLLPVALTFGWWVWFRPVLGSED